MTFMVSLDQYCRHSPHSVMEGYESHCSEMFFCLLMTMLLSGNQKHDARDTVYIKILLDILCLEETYSLGNKAFKKTTVVAKSQESSPIFPLK